MFFGISQNFLTLIVFCLYGNISSYLFYFFKTPKTKRLMGINGRKYTVQVGRYDVNRSIYKFSFYKCFLDPISPKLPIYVVPHTLTKGSRKANFSIKTLQGFFHCQLTQMVNDGKQAVGITAFSKLLDRLNCLFVGSTHNMAEVGRCTFNFQLLSQLFLLYIFLQHLPIRRNFSFGVRTILLDFSRLNVEESQVCQNIINI